MFCPLRISWTRQYTKYSDADKNLNAHTEKNSKKKSESCYRRTKPFHVISLRVAQTQFTQGSAVGWECAVQKQLSLTEVVIFQLRIVLVFVLGRVRRASLTTVLVAQVDDRGAGWWHADQRLQRDSEIQKETLSNLKCKSRFRDERRGLPEKGDNQELVLWSVQCTAPFLYSHCVT